MMTFIPNVRALFRHRWATQCPCLQRSTLQNLWPTVHTTTSSQTVHVLEKLTGHLFCALCVCFILYLGSYFFKRTIFLVVQPKTAVVRSSPCFQRHACSHVRIKKTPIVTCEKTRADLCPLLYEQSSYEQSWTTSLFTSTALSFKVVQAMLKGDLSL